jgi:hypothetical protein
MDRHMKRVAALRKAVFESKGTLEPAVRLAASRGQGGPEGGLPEEFRAYVEKVHRHAYKVVDEDLASLERAGHGQDQLFELTVSAAVGAGLLRLERGLAALRKEP